VLGEDGGGAYVVPASAVKQALAEWGGFKD
jgi:hypothetical protein